MTCLPVIASVAVESSSKYGVRVATVPSRGIAAWNTAGPVAFCGFDALIRIFPPRIETASVPPPVSVEGSGE